ncbi:MAG: hypothetical protein OEX12_08925 [Gammaproteobacteria bacterium]|nr:hypothetical protein [Gammaproteobacteria bacterium]
MELKLAKLLVTVLEDHGEEASIYEDYSGRGMYGGVTVGVSTSAYLSTIMTCIIVAADQFVDYNNEPLFRDMDTLRSDSLGVGFILY